MGAAPNLYTYKKFLENFKKNYFTASFTRSLTVSKPNFKACYFIKNSCRNFIKKPYSVQPKIPYYLVNLN